MMNLSNTMAIAQMNSDEKQDFLDIKIRPITVSDTDDCMEWLTDHEKIGKFWVNLPSKEEAMEYLKEEVIPDPRYKAISVNNKPIGLISVTAGEGDDSCKAEVGYVVAPKYWGKGIATKAVKMVATQLFLECPRLKKLEALVDAENLASQKVLEKAGFDRKHVLKSYCLMEGKPPKDMIVFSLLYTDTVVASPCKDLDSPTKFPLCMFGPKGRHPKRLSDGSDLSFIYLVYE